MSNFLDEFIGPIPEPEVAAIPLPVIEGSQSARYVPSVVADAAFKRLMDREMMKTVMGEDFFDTVKAFPSDQSSGCYDLPAELLSLLDNTALPDSEDDSDEDADVCQCKCIGCASGSCSACSGPSKCRFFAAARYGVASKRQQSAAVVDFLLAKHYSRHALTDRFCGQSFSSGGRE
jgi:hypothetical protein